MHSQVNQKWLTHATWLCVTWPPCLCLLSCVGVGHKPNGEVQGNQSFCKTCCIGFLGLPQHSAINWAAQNNRNLLSQFWRSEIKVPAGLTVSRGFENPFHASPLASSGCQQFLAFHALQGHHSNLCLRPHTVLPHAFLYVFVFCILQGHSLSDLGPILNPGLF